MDIKRYGVAAWTTDQYRATTVYIYSARKMLICGAQLARSRNTVVLSRHATRAPEEKHVFEGVFTSVVLTDVITCDRVLCQRTCRQNGHPWRGAAQLRS